MPTTFGEKIRGLRRAARLSLDALAERAGMSKSYLWELENRDSTRPSADKLAALANHLNTSVSYLLEEGAAAPEERHLDEAFFRNYQGLDSADKDRLRKIAEAFRRSGG
jgi:transcriptional regulator with XRE-family HTH domain